MELTVDCLSLVGEYQDWIQESIPELGRQLRHLLGRSASLQSIPIPTSNWPTVERYLRAGISGHRDFPEMFPPEFVCRRFFIVIPPDHGLVEFAQASNPRAHWGIAVPRRFAVAWVMSQHLWWHEVLHLLNAKDCYNRFGMHRCPEPRCLMQASPCPELCGEHLNLCSKNRVRISRELMSICEINSLSERPIT